MRVLICGGRDYEDAYNFDRMVEEILKEKGIVDPIIIHGAADGVDTLADEFARTNYFRCLRFPAKWHLHKKRAGPIRNKQMLDEGKPHLVIAFPTPSSIGTWDMISKSKRSNIEVIVREVSIDESI